MYSIEVPGEELELAEGIEAQWKEVAAQAKQVDRSLVTVKRKFTKVHCNQLQWHIYRRTGNFRAKDIFTVFALSV